MRKIINDNFAIYKNNQIISKDEIIAKTELFAAKLKTLNKSEVCIYLDDCYDFIVAFFAALGLRLKIYISQKDENCDIFYINNKKFNEILNIKIDKNSTLNIDKNAQFYMQTSGSSKVAKKVLKSVEQMLNETKVLNEKIGLNSDDLIVANIPFLHLFGLSTMIFLPILAGAKIENEQILYPENLLSYNKENFTLISTGTALKALSQNDLNTLKIKQILSAGSKLEESLREKFANIKIFNIYGSTETGIIASNEGQGLKLFSEVCANVDENGILSVSSPWCQNDSKNGDLAKIDGEYITLLGRSDRSVKLHEKRFNLDDIESLIKKNSFFNDAFVGLESGKSRFSALLVLSAEGKKELVKSGRNGVLKALKNELNSHIGNEIRYFYIREKLPFNELGKITKDDFNKCCATKYKIKPKITEQNSECIKASAYISEEAFCFEGHFADFAVLPGFIQLGFIIDLLPFEFDSYIVENVKFTGLIRPCETIEIEILFKEKVYFSIKKGDLECAKGRIKL